jgi:plastocyanin
MRSLPFLLLAGFALVMLAVLYGGFLGSAIGESDYEMDVTGITPTSQKGAPSPATGDAIERTYTVKISNLGAETDAGVVDLGITIPANSFVALDCQGCPLAILERIMQQGNKTVVAIKPISGSWGGNRDGDGDNTAYIDEDGVITWPSGSTESAAPTGWSIGNPTKASWNHNSGKPMEPSESNFIGTNNTYNVNVEITVGFANWAPPGTYTIQSDVRSWTDYDSTFTSGDPDGQATMTIDPPDLSIGSYDYISHAIGQSGEGLGWSKTSGGDEYFHFRVEVLNTDTETIGAFRVGLLDYWSNPLGIQVAIYWTGSGWAIDGTRTTVEGAEILAEDNTKYVAFKATAAQLGMANGPGGSVSGTYTFYLAVDTESNIAESNENNNRQAIDITAVSNQTDQNSNLSRGQIGYDTPLNGGTYDCSSELNNYDFESSDNSPTGSTMAQEDSQGTWIVTIVKIDPQVPVNAVRWFVLDADGDICAEGLTTDIYGLFPNDDWNILFVDNDFDGKLSPGDTYEIHDLDGVHALRLWYGTLADGGSSNGNHDVSITDGMAFSPENLTINVGDTVVWTNNDDSPHTVTADDDQFNSGNMGEGATWSYTFTVAGTYDYYCSYHSSMTGTVTVVEGNVDDGEGNGDDDDGLDDWEEVVEETNGTDTDDDGEDDGELSVPAPSVISVIIAVAVIALRRRY